VFLQNLFGLGVLVDSILLLVLYQLIPLVLLEDHFLPLEPHEAVFPRDLALLLLFLQVLSDVVLVDGHVVMSVGEHVVVTGDVHDFLILTLFIEFLVPRSDGVPLRVVGVCHCAHGIQMHSHFQALQVSQQRVCLFVTCERVEVTRGLGGGLHQFCSFSH